ncbi:MAG: glucan biosynthesis protein G [Betaproteobacteria bacterium]|nr:glucan biosynthesis protein G [Betaproteobacteria bacterium]
MFAAHARGASNRLAPFVLAFFFILLSLPASKAAYAFGFEEVAARARALAAKPYDPGPGLPKALQNLTYDQYRDIRFKPDRQYWRGAHLPFELAFFHLGWHFDRPVKLYEVAGGDVRPIRFDPRDFDYGANRIDTAKLGAVGFAGFRVHYAINTPKYKDEVLVFLGASYFRALGKGQVYGLSARGLAVDTALASGEEFPRFTTFWIERPAPGAKTLTLYALLDSKRVTGAYRFVLRPGVSTAMQVKARIFLREPVGKLGLAPLTSMFFFGANQHGTGDDYRPEVHDSDGLSLHAGNGEWLWRALVNPKRLLVTSFATTNPRGFGLMQRERRFDHYEDLEARYDNRPSAWVEPEGSWGKGRVELVEIPTPDETNDNIVAYWVPDREPAPGKPFDFAYRLLWEGEQQTHPPHAWVAQTLRGRGYTPKPDDSIGFIVDFEGPALKRLPANAVPESVVSADANGQVVESVTERNPVTGGVRLALRVRRIDKDKPVELRAALRQGDRTLSETWSYILPPG